MRIEIAPDFYCDDWEELETKLDPDGDWGKNPVAWGKAIDVIQSRIETRFLRCADELQELDATQPETVRLHRTAGGTQVRADFDQAGVRHARSGDVRALAKARR